MRRIAIINQKGGVGKTTTAVNLSVALAHCDCRVLLVDLDPQAHATLHLGAAAADNRPTMYDVLVGKRPLTDAWRAIPVAADGAPVENCATREAAVAGSRLWLAPSHIDLAAAEVELAGVVGREAILRDRLAAADEQFDYVLIDCPPSLGVLTLNALAAVDEVLLPMQPHFLALHGMSKLLETIQLVATRLNPRLRLSGVIYCMYDSGTRLAAEVTRDVDAFFAQSRQGTTPWSSVQTFQTRVRRNIRLAEAPSFGQSIFHYAPESNGADDYRRLAEELRGSAARGV